MAIFSSLPPITESDDGRTWLFRTRPGCHSRKFQSIFLTVHFIPATRIRMDIYHLPAENWYPPLFYCLNFLNWTSGQSGCRTKKTSLPFLHLIRCTYEYYGNSSIVPPYGFELHLEDCLFPILFWQTTRLNKKTLKLQKTWAIVSILLLLSIRFGRGSDPNSQRKILFRPQRQMVEQDCTENFRQTAWTGNIHYSKMSAIPGKQKIQQRFRKYPPKQFLKTLVREFLP